MKQRYKTYLALTKPGIVRGNLLAAAAGFFFAANGDIDWLLCFGLLLGTALIIASGCVYNNVLDRNIDAAMERTKKRALVTGAVSIPAALIFATLLAIAGTATLLILVNGVTTLLGLFGLFSYVVLYGWAKRNTPLSTIIGAVPGAIPIMAGYTAVSGQIDGTAWLLFALMGLWQLPHFYAISIYRRDDYANAKLPVWSVRYGVAATKWQMLITTVLFALCVCLLRPIAGASWITCGVLLALCAWWLWLQIGGWRKGNDVRWAKQAFGVSLVVMLGMSIVLALNWLFI